LLGTLRALPFTLLSLPAGALVDRWDRKRTMVLCDSGRALALGSVPLALALGHVTIAHLVVVSIIEGTLFTFFSVAESAALPRVVPASQLAPAVAGFQASDSAAMMLGPSLGGLLYGLSRVLPFGADAVSFALSAVALRSIRVDLQEPRTDERRAGSLWWEIREGLAWLWHNPAMRFIALLTGGINLCGYGYALILIVLGERMGAGSGTIGLILAGGGAGSVAGALLAAPLQKRFGFRWVVIAMTWVLALTWPLYLAASTPLALGAVNGLIFVAVPIYFGAQYSYRLARIPDRLQGRVNSAYKLIAFGAQPLSLALTGALLEWSGTTVTILALFVPQVLLALAATASRHLRHDPTPVVAGDG
jgi:MFS family permease